MTDDVPAPSTFLLATGVAQIAAGGNGPAIGSTVVVTVGTGGAGGYAGSCIVFNGFAYVPVTIYPGAAGANGLVKISWS